MSSKENREAYWKANLKLMGVLLAIWFFISYVCGILFVDELNTIHFAGFKLGFWIAQQGSMFVYLALIFVYAAKMNKLDKKYGLEE